MALLAFTDDFITATSLYTASGPVTANVNLCNRTGASIAVSIALVPSGTSSPGTQHWIEFGTPLPANGVLERTGIPLGNGDQVFVNAAATGVTAAIYGLV